MFTLVAALLLHPVGALNPAVTQENIYSTICVTGWTATVRPPVRYTNALKRRQMAAMRLTGRLSDYEEDHFVPLGVGGDPYSPANLWPEPWPAARAKDTDERRVQRLVCSGRWTLKQGQAFFLRWSRG
jgi:hypothetical protein